MRTSKTVSITLPYDMLARAMELARAEDRTMSELIREALRQYERQRQWAEIRAYGTETTKKLGLTKQDVAPLIKQARMEILKKNRRGKRKPKRPKH